MSESETFIVGDRKQRHEHKNTKVNTPSDEDKLKAHTLKNSDFDLFRNLVGISYVSFGIYGFFNGIYRSTKEVTFKNRPKKLIATGLLNIIGRQVSRYANAGACLFLLYSIVRKSTNYLFDEELEELTPIQRNFVYGFLSGAFFKCSRGLGPALFAGSFMGLGCAGMLKLYEYKIISINLH